MLIRACKRGFILLVLGGALQGLGACQRQAVSLLGDAGDFSLRCFEIANRTDWRLKVRVWVAPRYGSTEPPHFTESYRVEPRETRLVWLLGTEAVLGEFFVLQAVKGDRYFTAVGRRGPTSALLSECRSRATRVGMEPKDFVSAEQVVSLLSSHADLRLAESVAGSGRAREWALKNRTRMWIEANLIPVVYASGGASSSDEPETVFLEPGAEVSVQPPTAALKEGAIAVITVRSTFTALNRVLEHAGFVHWSSRYRVLRSVSFDEDPSNDSPWIPAGLWLLPPPSDSQRYEIRVDEGNLTGLERGATPRREDRDVKP